jgi:hypothetical protein
MHTGQAIRNKITFEPTGACGKTSRKSKVGLFVVQSVLVNGRFLSLASEAWPSPVGFDRDMMSRGFWIQRLYRPILGEL